MPYNLSFWEQDTYFANQDFIIAGAGLLGLWTAYELKKSFPGSSVMIIERGGIPMGASTRNAGFACFGSPTELMGDEEKMGESDMLKLFEMRYRGISKIRTTLSDHQIDFDNCGGFECYIKQMHDFSTLGDKVNKLNKSLQSITGLSKTFSWCNEKIAEKGLSGFDGMIENTLEGGIHSGKLVNALTIRVLESGVKIIWGTTITDWVQINDSIAVHTDKGELKTSKLIFATNAFKLLKFNNLNYFPARGQVIITSPIRGLKLSGTFHFDEGFYYFRNVGNRILLGGGRNIAVEDEETTSFDTTELIQNNLQKFLYQYITNNNEIKIENKWSGIMAFTDNKMPQIIQVDENVFSMISCNGMGVALSPVIAELMVEMV